MRLVRTLALALFAGAVSFLPTDAQSPAGPALPEVKVLYISGRGEVDFEFADGQLVTVAPGKPLNAEWRLEDVGRTADGKEAVVVLRNENTRRQLRVPGEVLAQKVPRREQPSVSVQSQFYEVLPAALERVQQVLDTTPSVDPLALEILRHALDGGAPPQVLTPGQFEVLSQFLLTSREAHFVNVPGVVSKTGQRAAVEIVREFRYPTSWDNDNTSPDPDATAFKTRRCGVTLEIAPTIKYGPLIELEMMPQVVELLGAEDLENTMAYPYQSRAEHLPERAYNPLEKGRFTVARPARYVFSARAEKALVDVPSGYGVLLTNLVETEKIAPFEKTAPQGRLIVLIKADVMAK